MQFLVQTKFCWKLWKKVVQSWFIFYFLQQVFTTCNNGVYGTYLVGIEAMILKVQLWWIGHVMKMDSSRLPRQLLYGELVQGSCPLGPPKKWFTDLIKDCLKQLGTSPGELESRALDGIEWCSVITRACTSFRSNQRECIMAAGDQRKAADPPSATATATLKCPLEMLPESVPPGPGS